MARYTNKKTPDGRDIISDQKSRLSAEHLEIIGVRQADGTTKQFVVIDLKSFRAYLHDVERMLDIVDSYFNPMAEHGSKAKSTDS